MSIEVENKKGYSCELILLLFLLILLLFIVFGAVLWYKMTPVWYSVIFGGVSGIIAFFICFKLFGFITNMWFGAGSPPCRRCGRNGQIVTETIDGKAAYQVDGSNTLICRKCGERYLLIGRNFFRLDEHNHKYPYMRWKRMWGWVSDTSQEEKS